jgi:hypothetical protein
VKRILILVIVLTLVPGVAWADNHVCWNEQIVDDRGFVRSVTRCRVNGEIVDYASEAEVPIVLYPDVGVASNGACWYWRSAWANWVLFTRYGDNTADLGYDPGAPGGPVDVFVTYPICVSEPTDEDPGEVLAWNLISAYVHQLPAPSFNPPVPWGLTGAETYLALSPPPPYADSLSPPAGGVLFVEAWVQAVMIDWGDGVSEAFPPELYPLLTGYPSGIGPHVYEVKTCEPPGSRPRCHESLSSYPLEVSYQWAARWRIGAGDWITLAVPPTTTLTPYPVREVIAVLDTRG